MEDKTRYVLYVIMLGLVLGALGSIFSGAFAGNQVPLATFFLVCTCVFLVLFNYEPVKTPRQIELALIKRVTDAWIADLNNFEKALPDGSLFPVNFSFCADSLPHLNKIPDLTGTGGSEVTIGFAFKKTRGSLLVRGEAGSGKTVSLLRLTRELIKQAETDPVAPIPVFLSLSTWNSERLELWLVNELRRRYDVAEEVARSWILGKRLLYLLDDLDSRQGCVGEINRFLTEIGCLGIIVATRNFEGTTKLNLKGAICLEKLSEAFVRKFLAEFNPTFSSTDQAVGLARSPLMLRVISLVPDREFEEITKSPDSLPGRFIKAHVKHQLRLAGKITPPYTATHLRNWLSWLASLDAVSQAGFAIEEIQPNWLKPWGQYVYVFLSRITGALTIMALGVGLMFLSQKMGHLVGSASFNVDFINVRDDLRTWFLITVGVGGLTVIILDCLRLFVLPPSSSSETLSSLLFKSFQRSSVWSSLIVFSSVFWLSALSFGLGQGKATRGAAAYGIAFALTYWNRDRERKIDSDIGTAHKLVWSGAHIPRGLCWGLVGGYLSGILYVFHRVTLNWSTGLILTVPSILALVMGWKFWRSKAPDHLETHRIINSRFEFGLILAAVFGIGTALLIWSVSVFKPHFISVDVPELTRGLKTLCLFCLLGGMIGLIVRGLKKVSIVEERTPHQGLKTSLRTTVLLWLSVGAPTVLVLWGYSTRVMHIEGAFKESLFFGMMLGLLFGFSYGGLDIIYRFVLRLILLVRGNVPFFYATALDDAANLGLLRKVGHAYVFYHERVREHFRWLYEHKDSTG